MIITHDDVPETWRLAFVSGSHHSIPDKDDFLFFIINGGFFLNPVYKSVTIKKVAF